MKYSYVYNGVKLPEPLSNEEFVLYMKKYKDLSDMDAKKKLIAHNLRLVLYQAYRFENTGCELEELLSIGTFGLIKAIDTFDLDKGIKFATYASRCIDNEILMFLRKDRKYAGDISFNSVIFKDQDGNDLIVEDILEDKNFDELENYEREETNSIIRGIIDKLPERDKFIIHKRFGFNSDDKVYTQEEVAKLLGISRSWLSRIEKNILKTIKIQLEEVCLIESRNGDYSKPKENKKIHHDEFELIRNILLENKDLIFGDVEEFNMDGNGVSLEYIMQFREIVNHLSDNEKQIMYMRYGYNSENRIYTQSAVAHVFGRSQFYIGYIERKILTKMKKVIEDTVNVNIRVRRKN